MKPFHRLLTGLSCAMCALWGTSSLHAQAAEKSTVSAAPQTVAPWVIDFTTVGLWKVGGGATPLKYTFTPQIISVLCPPSTHRQLAGGTLLIRARLSLLIEPIIRGPENYFIGASAAGQLEWRHPSGKFAWFFASGGGIGVMDSKGHEIRGAQGQDFNLNWLIHSGVRVKATRNWDVAAGIYFQHISNGGMNKINPGVNALGPSLGISRPF